VLRARRTRSQHIGPERHHAQTGSWITRIGTLYRLLCALLARYGGGASRGFPLYNMQTAISTRARNVQGISFSHSARFSGSAFGIVAYNTRDFPQLSLRIGTGYPLDGAAGIRVLLGCGFPHLVGLPVSGTVVDLA